MRHRGPAERRQVHPLQRADQGRHRRGELPFLHHRAQRRASCRCRIRASDALAKIVKPQKIVPDRGRVRRHRGPRGRRQQGRGPGQQVPRQHPRDRRHRARGALLRAWRHRARGGQGRPDRRHRDHRHRAGAGRSRIGGKGAGPPRTRRQDRRQGIDRQARRAQAGARASERRQAGALDETLAGGQGAAARTVPADDEARHVRGQRQGRRLREQPAPRPRARAGRAGRRRGGAGVRRHRRGDVPARGRRTATSSWPISASRSRASTA